MRNLIVVLDVLPSLLQLWRCISLYQCIVIFQHVVMPIVLSSLIVAMKVDLLQWL